MSSFHSQMGQGVGKFAFVNGCVDAFERLERAKALCDGFQIDNRFGCSLGPSLDESSSCGGVSPLALCGAVAEPFGENK